MPELCQKTPPTPPKNPKPKHRPNPSIAQTQTYHPKRKAEALTASAERGEVPSPISREQEAPPDTRESEAEKREKKGITYSQVQRVFDSL